MYGILGNLQQLLGGQGPNSGGAQLQGPTSLSGYGRITDMMYRGPGFGQQPPMAASPAVMPPGFGGDMMQRAVMPPPGMGGGTSVSNGPGMASPGVMPPGFGGGMQPMPFDPGIGMRPGGMTNYKPPGGFGGGMGMSPPMNRPAVNKRPMPMPMPRGGLRGGR